MQPLTHTLVESLCENYKTIVEVMYSKKSILRSKYADLMVCTKGFYFLISPNGQILLFHAHGINRPRDLHVYNKQNFINILEKLIPQRDLMVSNVHLEI